MLGINWDDVVKMLQSIAPQLIVIGVFLLAAIIISIAVRKKKPHVRKFVRAQSWIAFLIATVIAVNFMLYGGFRNVLNLASGSGTLTDETIVDVNDLGRSIADEGLVLLKNQDNALPLAQNSKLNVFGWASTNPIYGGTGSGSISDSYDSSSLLDGLHNAGFETNEELSSFYTDYRADRPVVGMFQGDWSLPEPTIDMYSDSLISNAKSFSDTAVVVLARSGGEGADLPQDVYKSVEADSTRTYTDNSSEARDFEDGDGYLTLTKPEKDLIAMVEKEFDKVTVVVNAANTMELGNLKDDNNIDSILWAIPPGQVGFDSVGRILSGQVTPSAKTPDTFVRDLAATPTANNFGTLNFDNMDQFKQVSPFNNIESVPSFVNYVENIYVGYKFWETAAAENLIGYDQQVVYPFGYGLSYTTFSQEMGQIENQDGEFSFDVTVTNTGDVAGKDVVEAYYTPPYTNGGIEKSEVNLLEFAKTSLLEPGQSETVTISFTDDDLASYDEQNAKAYVLDEGTYKISIRSDSHTVIDEQSISLDSQIVFDSPENSHSGDQEVATNRFDDARGDITYLSRKDGFANYEEATAAPTNFSMSEEHQATFIANDNYNPADYNDSSDEMPTTGADNGLVLGDLAGADYDDPRWDQLLDQLTVDDMDNLIANGGYHTTAIKSVGKVQVSDVDGPAALNNNFTGVGSIGLPASVSVAATWNADLARQYGDAIGKMAHEMKVTGWYAPAMNIHRSAYSGRNFEYFSEDGVLSGKIAAQEVKGASDAGVYAFIKHYALNDQETNRNSMLTTWSTEQAIREIYLKPFELAVKDGGTNAVMSSFNYIGTIYAGAHTGLLQDVLRGEWGFRGMVLTDYFAGYGYQNADQIIRGGGDLMLATLDITNHVTDRSATSVQAMRTACHNILYTVAHSWVYENGQPEFERPIWEWIAMACTIILGLGIVALEVIAVRRFQARRRALAAEPDSRKEAVSQDASSAGATLES